MWGDHYFSKFNTCRTTYLTKDILDARCQITLLQRHPQTFIYLKNPTVRKSTCSVVYYKVTKNIKNYSSLTFSICLEKIFGISNANYTSTVHRATVPKTGKIKSKSCRDYSLPCLGITISSPIKISLD